MGGLFCSYYINNRISRVRKAIETSQLDDLKNELRDLRKNDQILMNVSIDSYGNTPLILSIDKRQLKSLEYLLEELKVDPNVANEFTLYSPLHICCITAPFDQKRVFSNFKSKSRVEQSKSLDDLTIKRKSKMESSLMSNQSDDAINKQRIKSDKKLLTSKLTRKKKMYASIDSAINSIGSQNNSESKNIPTNFVKVNQTPVDTETLTKMFNLLIKNGADVNNLAKINRLTRMPGFEMIRFVTPLHIAVYNQNLTAINMLIKNGSNVNQCDPISKITPLHMACYMSKIEIVSALLESKSLDVELRSKDGFNCLHWLALSENDENSFGIAMLLISNIIRKYESMYASNSSDFLYACDRRLKSFINQNGIDNNQTPLMFACMKNKLNLIKILLDYDVEIELKDKNGKSACDYGKNNESCVYLLNSFNKFKKLTMKKKNSNKSLQSTDTFGSSKTDILSIKNLNFDN